MTLKDKLHLRVCLYFVFFSKWWSCLSLQRAGGRSFLLLATTPSLMSCWSASPPPSAAGAQQDILHITVTARLHLQDTFIFIWTSFCGFAQKGLMHVFVLFFVCRNGASGGRMQFGITHSDVRNTSSFWKAPLWQRVQAGKSWFKNEPVHDDF